MTDQASQASHPASQASRPASQASRASQAHRVDRGRRGEPAGEPLGTLLTPMVIRTAGERIAERIVTAIALGEFVPGQRLPTERELAGTLEVSRSTVREAMQRLQASGYVATRRGRGGGTYVLTGLGPDSDDMIARTLGPAWAELTEVLDFRRLVEKLIARTAAERRDDRDIALIRKTVSAYADAPDRDASRLADHAMHQAIARATHNSRLAELSAQVRREVSLGFDAEPYTPEVRGRALHQHPRLADAVIAGDADLAGRLAAEHFSLTEDMLSELHARIKSRSEGEPNARSDG
jgi:GntR family transcriptional repressor for pyruvate dehydrogenase complex